MITLIDAETKHVELGKPGQTSGAGAGAAAGTRAGKGEE